MCRWALEISAFVFRRTWESICILKRRIKTMLKPDWVNTNQSRQLFPLLFFARAGNRLACSHLSKPLSVREQQRQGAVGGSRADKNRDLTPGPHPTTDKRSDQSRSGDGDQGQLRPYWGMSKDKSGHQVRNSRIEGQEQAYLQVSSVKNLSWQRELLGLWAEDTSTELQI